MFHLRGHPSNYDAWAAAGATGWSYEDLLPYLMRSERAREGDSQVRGTSGPMLVGTMPQSAHSPLIEALHAAARDAGHPDTADVNGAQQEGIGRPEWNVVDGRRQSAADAYLRPRSAHPPVSPTRTPLFRSCGHIVR
jgi:choline dehydrogenase